MYIQNQINIIWLGDFLWKSHQERIIKWRAMNPEHPVNLWIDRLLVDEATHQQFQGFCTEHGALLHDTSELHPLMSENVKLWLVDLAAQKCRNYAAMSDIYRMYVLRSLGGWYFDSDINPLKSLPVDLDLAHGFAVDLTENEGTVHKYTPAMIASTPDSNFLKVSIEIIEMLAAKMASDITTAVSSLDGLVRHSATCLTTGAIVLSACTRLYTHSNNPLLSKGFFVNDSVAYSQLTLSALGLVVNYFENKMETSWLLNENGSYLQSIENPDSIRALISAEQKATPRSCLILMAKKNELLCDITPYPLSPNELPLAPLPTSDPVDKVKKRLNQFFSSRQIPAVAIPESSFSCSSDR